MLLLSELLKQVYCHIDNKVKSGDILGYIMDPYDGSVIQVLNSPVDGRVFFSAYGPYEYEGSLVFRIVKE